MHRQGRFRLRFGMLIRSISTGKEGTQNALAALNTLSTGADSRFAAVVIFLCTERFRTTVVNWSC